MENKMLEQYIVTALWSSTGDDSEPLDARYSADDIAPDGLAKAARDCAEFERCAAPIVRETCPRGVSLSSLGHDFWLTRNGHGAGFWDGDYPKAAGERLTALSKVFGECDAIVGDDGKIYFEGGKDL